MMEEAGVSGPRCALHLQSVIGSCLAAWIHGTLKPWLRPLWRCGWVSEGCPPSPFNHESLCEDWLRSP